jgi:hypothetical protein
MSEPSIQEAKETNNINQIDEQAILLDALNGFRQISETRNLLDAHQLANAWNEKIKRSLMFNKRVRDTNEEDEETDDDIPTWMTIVHEFLHDYTENRRSHHYSIKKIRIDDLFRTFRKKHFKMYPELNDITQKEFTQAVLSKLKLYVGSKDRFYKNNHGYFDLRYLKPFPKPPSTSSSTSSSSL